MAQPNLSDLTFFGIKLETASSSFEPHRRIPCYLPGRQVGQIWADPDGKLWYVWHHKYTIRRWQLEGHLHLSRTDLFAA